MLALLSSLVRWSLGNRVLVVALTLSLTLVRL